MSSTSSTDSEATSSEQDPCKKLLLWTQYDPTCWFNAVLTALFHSQYSRDMILKLSKDWKDKSTMQKLAEHIVKYKYVQSDSFERDRLFYYKVRPEHILDYLHTKYPEYVKKDAKKQEGNSHDMLNKMYKILNINYLSFEICINLNDPTSTKLYYNIWDSYYKFNNILEEYIPNAIEEEELKKKLLTNPAVLLQYINNSCEETLYSGSFKHYNLEDKMTFDNISALKSLKDIIVYNGQKYILDSIILSNHNRSEGGHAIAGITCNKKKYVYNGWTNDTNDPNLQKTVPTLQKTDTALQKTVPALQTKEYIPKIYREVIKEIPCDLIKFDWYENKYDFYIKKDCNLPIFNSEEYGEELYFNFSKGIRTYIYIREDLCDKGKAIKTDTSNFIKFKVPRDLSPNYNSLEEYNITTVSTKYNNITEIINELIINNENKYYQIIFIINYLKKYINQINNYSKDKINSELISSIIYFKYTVILFYIILLINSQFFKNIEYNISIEDFKKYFKEFYKTKPDFIKNNINLLHDINEAIEYILKKIKNDIDKDFINFYMSLIYIIHKLLYNLQLYYKNIEEEYIEKLGLMNIYTEYKDDEKIINYLFDLKKLVKAGNIEKTKYSIEMLNKDINLKLKNTQIFTSELLVGGATNDINILKEFIRRIIY
jgi:hypothetical protein